MPFSRPNLTQLRQQARAAFAAKLPGADTALRRSSIAVSADTMAGLVNGQYGYLDWLALQPFASTSEADYLQVQGAEYDLAKLPATLASGNAVFTGIAETPISSGTVVQDSAGMQFETLADAVLGGDGTVTIAIEALSGGYAGNDAAGAPLNLVNAIAGVNATANVDSAGLSGGTDEESDAQYRARILTRKRQPPQGGVAYDYESWAKSVPGVTRAWAIPLNRGGGTADLTFVMDGRSNIIPLSADVDAVQAAIEAKRPVTDDCVVFAPIASPVNFTIAGLASAQQASVTAALTALMQSLDVAAGLSFQDDIVPAVAGGAGTSAFTVTSPAADVAGTRGTILTLGTIAFT